MLKWLPIRIGAYVESMSDEKWYCNKLENLVKYDHMAYLKVVFCRKSYDLMVSTDNTAYPVEKVNRVKGK